MRAPSQSPRSTAYDPTAMTRSEESPHLLTLEEAAAVLRVPVSWLRHRVANRQVTCTRLGRHIRFTREQVVAIVDSGVQPVVEESFTGLTRRARRSR